MTWGLILLNVGIFLLELGATDNGVKALLASFAATPAAITHQVPSAGRFPPELTLFSYMFLHGGFEHILGNMIYLWVFGDDIEDALGWALQPILRAYRHRGRALFCLAQPQVDDAAGRRLRCHLGDFGGVLAAATVRQSFGVCASICRAGARVLGDRRLDTAAALPDRQPGNDGIAYLAHGGGLIAGALLFLVMRPANVRLFECVEQPGEEGAAAA